MEKGGSVREFVDVMFNITLHNFILDNLPLYPSKFGWKVLRPL